MTSLMESGVLAELSKTHSITFYTFDSQLAGPWAIVSEDSVRFVDVDGAAGEAQPTSVNSSSNAATMSLDDEKKDDANKSRIRLRSKNGNAFCSLAGRKRDLAKLCIR